MNADQKKALKSMYIKRCKLTKKLQEMEFAFGEAIEEEWGFNHSETNDDRIIDTLDYGTNSLSFDLYVKKMDQYKIDLENTGEFGDGMDY